jgi:flagellar basal-body rod protein FlgC
MDFIKAMITAASGLKAQSGRMRILSENIANADSTARTPDGDPYRRRIPTFEAEMQRKEGAKIVTLGRVKIDDSPFRTHFEPSHPAAGPDGYVKMPNVNTFVEAMDMRTAQRSYEANLNVIQSTRAMILRTLEILRV